MIFSPQEHREQVRRLLMAPSGSLIEIVERCMKSPAVLSEDDPHPPDEERLQVARAMGVCYQSFANHHVV